MKSLFNFLEFHERLENAINCDVDKFSDDTNDSRQLKKS